MAIFTRVPGAAPAKTRLAGSLGPETAAAFARAFLLDTLRRTAELDAERSLWFTPPDTQAVLCDLLPGSLRQSLPLVAQPPGTLDERLKAAVATLLAEGSGQVCVIGSDSPTLPLALLSEAFESLQTADFVLVPADDGGFVLLGARLPLSGVLSGVDWSTDRVLAQTHARLAARASVRVLSTWYDVDTAEDLRRLASDPGLTDCPATQRLLERVDWAGTTDRTGSLGAADERGWGTKESTTGHEGARRGGSETVRPEAPDATNPQSEE